MPDFPEWYAESLRFIAEKERQGTLNSAEAEKLRRQAINALITYQSIGFIGEMGSTQLWEPEKLASRQQSLGIVI